MTIRCIGLRQPPSIIFANERPTTCSNYHTTSPYDILERYRLSFIAFWPLLGMQFEPRRIAEPEIHSAPWIQIIWHPSLHFEICVSITAPQTQKYAVFEFGGHFAQPWRLVPNTANSKPACGTKNRRYALLQLNGCLSPFPNCCEKCCQILTNGVR